MILADIEKISVKEAWDYARTDTPGPDRHGRHKHKHAGAHYN
jgi:hypothetical protein